MSLKRNNFLDHGVSDDESDQDAGYDSEAAEISKGARTSSSAATQYGAKRRKVSHLNSRDVSVSASNEDEAQSFSLARTGSEVEEQASEEDDDQDKDEEGVRVQTTKPHRRQQPATSPPTANGISSDSDLKFEPASIALAADQKRKKKERQKNVNPGVVYLSSLPPYLKPSALRNLLQQRGFEPINRLFLTPASKAKATSKKNSRQLYTEGWIEFASKKTARRCAETLNANIVGGRKGGFYYDDLWNMKYLKGMHWDELMAGIREERRDEEGRRDEERRVIAKETQRFIEGVEQGKRMEGMTKKRKAKEDKRPQLQDEDRDASGNGTSGLGRSDNIKRTWRQFEVKGKAPRQKQVIHQDVQDVLGKIF